MRLKARDITRYRMNSKKYRQGIEAGCKEINIWAQAVRDDIEDGVNLSDPAYHKIAVDNLQAAINWLQEITSKPSPT